VEGLGSKIDIGLAFCIYATIMAMGFLVFVLLLKSSMSIWSRAFIGIIPICLVPLSLLLSKSKIIHKIALGDKIGF